MLTFDSAAHAYYWHGQRVPGVTSLLQPIHDFSRVPRDVLEAAQRRGTYVHAMTELYDLGELDEDANAAVADGAYVGYLQAWKRFVAEYEPNWIDIESMGYSLAYGYAGTWDRRGTLGRTRPGPALIDIKTSGDPAFAWGVQTAAYRQIAMEREPSAALDLRATVQLHADGTFDFLPWTEPDDWRAFHALLTVHQWRTKRCMP